MDSSTVSQTDVPNIKITVTLFPLVTVNKYSKEREQLSTSYCWNFLHILDLFKFLTFVIYLISHISLSFSSVSDAAKQLHANAGNIKNVSTDWTALNITYAFFNLKENKNVLCIVLFPGENTVRFSFQRNKQPLKILNICCIFTSSL